MRHLSRARAARGLTLIELMIGLAIGAMLLMAGAPFYGDYVANSRLREAGNVMYAETMFAQSEAIKRNATVRVVVSGASVQTRDLSTGVPGTMIREVAMPSPVTAAAATTFHMGSDGRPRTIDGAGVMTGFTSVSINLKATGATCSSERRCPGLRVDAGGAVRLCGNHLSGCD